MVDLEIVTIKIKLAELLSEIQWHISDAEFYKTFSRAISFIRGYW